MVIFDLDFISILWLLSCTLIFDMLMVMLYNYRCICFPGGLQVLKTSSLRITYDWSRVSFISSRMIFLKLCFIFLLHIKLTDDDTQVEDFAHMQQK